MTTYAHVSPRGLPAPTSPYLSLPVPTRAYLDDCCVRLRVTACDYCTCDGVWFTHLPQAVAPEQRLDHSRLGFHRRRGFLIHRRASTQLCPLRRHGGREPQNLTRVGHVATLALKIRRRGGGVEGEGGSVSVRAVVDQCERSRWMPDREMTDACIAQRRTCAACQWVDMAASLLAALLSSSTCCRVLPTGC